MTLWLTSHFYIVPIIPFSQILKNHLDTNYHKKEQKLLKIVLRQISQWSSDWSQTCDSPALVSQLLGSQVFVHHGWIQKILFNSVLYWTFFYLSLVYFSTLLISPKDYFLVCSGSVIHSSRINKRNNRYWT
jgi:hypothetical protein